MLSLVAYMSHFEPIRLGAAPSEVPALLRFVPPNVTVHPMQFDDVWIRDTGPSVLVSDNRPPLAVDWHFNSWGGLFSEAASDDGVAADVGKMENLNVVRAPIVLEGGAVLTDGQGTLITTEESVLGANRNPGLTKKEAEKVFRSFLNVDRIIWLPHGLANDEAGGHVDNVCSYASAQALLVSSTDDCNHPSYEHLYEARKILQKELASGSGITEIVSIPIPNPTSITSDEARGFAVAEGTINRQRGHPLAPSYANLVIANGAVFLPVFNDPADESAIDIVAKAFPGRVVVPYHSREFLLGGGTLHCLTKEIPA